MTDTFDVVLPDGTPLKGIPVGTTKDEVMAKAKANGYDFDKPASASLEKTPMGFKMGDSNPGSGDADYLRKNTYAGNMLTGAQESGVGLMKGARNLGESLYGKNPHDDAEKTAFDAASKKLKGEEGKGVGNWLAREGADVAMLPAMGGENAMFKAVGGIENAATRAFPEIAQALGEGKVAPALSSIAKTGAAGATGGAIYGAGTGNNVKGSAALGAAGGLGGQAAVAALPKVFQMLKPFMGNASSQEIEASAKKIIQDLQSKDVKGGGLSADDIINKVKEAQASGKPLVPVDVAGENLRGRAGTIARSPGEGKQRAQQFFKERDAAAAKRLSGDLDKYLGTGSAKEAIKKTAAERSTAARPLFDKAYKGGSLAPLETQYQKAWQESTKTISKAADDIKKIEPRITILTAKLSQTNNVYQQAALRKELEAEESKLSESLQNLNTAKDDERLSFQSMRQSQTDRATSAPGAVWSPKIQRWLSNPEVKKGITKGLAIERNTADAAGHPFDPTEYAITGSDKEGNPIVGKVPNMRLLASAKEGLDARLLDKEIRDEKTGILTKEGLSIKKLRDSLRAELVRLNPDYAKALESWAGDSAIINATNYGKNIALKQPAENIAEELSAMSPAEKEAARVGVSDELKVRLSKSTFNGDESKKILNSEYMKAQLKPFFRTESEYERFVKNVTTETTMFETPVSMKGGSKTPERQAEDAAGLQDAVGHAAKGNWAGLLMWLKDKADTTGWKNKAINDEIAKLLFNANIPADYLKSSAVLGEPRVGVAKKVAPYVGTGVGLQLNR